MGHSHYTKKKQKYSYKKLIQFGAPEIMLKKVHQYDSMNALKPTEKILIFRCKYINPI